MSLRPAAPPALHQTAPEHKLTPSLPLCNALTARENPFLASASNSCILEHVSKCLPARPLIEIQLGDLVPWPSALTWAIARRPWRAGVRLAGTATGTALPSSTPELCPPSRDSSPFVSLSAGSLPHTHCLGQAGHQGSSAKTLWFTPMPPGENPALPIPTCSLGVKGAVWGEGEDPAWQGTSPLSSLELVLRTEGGTGTWWCQGTQVLCLLASHPARPGSQDPGCSVSHWSKAASRRILRQSELLRLCWHRSEPGGCCRAGGVVQGPRGPPAGAPLLKGPSSVLLKT